jgi:hypothetical protein
MRDLIWIDAMKSAGPKINVSMRGEALTIWFKRDEAFGILDLGFDPDPAYIESHRLLNLSQQQIERYHLFGAANLRQHHAVEMAPGPSTTSTTSR